MKYLDIINSLSYLGVDLKMGQNHITDFIIVWHLIFQIHFFENLSQLIFGLNWTK